MHETVFVNEIFSVVRNKFPRDAIGSVVCVNVKLSPLSHVTKQGLLGSYQELAKGGCFERIKLNIEPLALLLHCRSCKNDATVTNPTLNCPSCNSQDIELNFDKEFMIESIEIDKQE
jgi:Zn finger protein HypA/HybF involved in hydrogenase expression